MALKYEFEAEEICNPSLIETNELLKRRNANGWEYINSLLKSTSYDKIIFFFRRELPKPI